MTPNNELLRKMQLQAKVDGEIQGEEDMKKVYQEQRKAMNKVNEFVAFLFGAYAVNSILKPRKSQRDSILKQSESLLVGLGKKLGKKEVQVVSDILDKQYKESYYKNAFIYELGGMRINFKIERQEFIYAIVNKEFKGEEFSSRIWTNKARLIDSLQKEIYNNLKGKTPLDVAIRNIRKEFNVSAYESKRLFVTELTRVQSEAHDNIARQAGIKRQLYDVTLDNRTSNWCIPYADTTWDIDDPQKPIPPLHPLCRSALIDLTDSWQFTTKKDNESKELIDYVKYDTWLKSKGIAK